MRNIEIYEKMSKLSFIEIEREDATKIWEHTLKCFDQIKGIDTTNIEPLFTVLSHQAPLRDDIVIKNSTEKKLLFQGASSDTEENDGYYKVPKSV